MKTDRTKKTFFSSLAGFMNEKILLFVVFITGACVLVLEVVATRILSPYFGTTIYTISSVIGVILAALSFGYYWGGKYADKNPRLDGFYRIIYLSGLAAFLVYILTFTLLPLFGLKLSFSYGPLLSSLFLFSLPSFLLGSLSPYAIKLQEIRFPKEGVGKLSGEVFFASTFGSIFGTLFGGFYLIPTLGLNLIVLGVGSVLICVGLIGLYSQKESSIQLIKLIFLSSVFFVLCLDLNTENPNSIYSKDGLYGKIIIFDGEYNNKTARVLMQDRSMSSANYLDSEELAFEYTKYYQLYKLMATNPERVLFIGGGAYSMPSILIKELPESEVYVSEIEPALYDLSKKYFNVRDNPRLHNVVIDGRRLLYDSNENYDMIFSDVYSSMYSIPPHFTTKEFFDLAKSRLNENGIFVANVIGNLANSEHDFIFSEIKTFRAVFPSSFFFAVTSPALDEPQNIIFLGFNTKYRLGLKDLTKGNKDNAIIVQLETKHIDIDRFDLSNYPYLTDNYSPVEALNAELFKSMTNMN